MYKTYVTKENFPYFYQLDYEDIEGWDEIEIHPVAIVRVEDDDTAHMEPVDNEDEADFWSVYIHIVGKGLMCIADFELKEEAITFKKLIELLIKTYKHDNTNS